MLHVIKCMLHVMIKSLLHVTIKCMLYVMILHVACIVFVACEDEFHVTGDE